MASNFTSSTLAFTDILGSAVPLKVPSYQRSYSWERTDVEALWHDLLEHWTNGGRFAPAPDDPYFLGTIVTIPGAIGSTNTLLDGQQRLATITIMLAVARNRLYSLRSPEAGTSAKQIDAGLIRTKMPDIEPFQLRLNETDNDFFTEEIQRWPRPSPQPKPILAAHRRIRNARYESEQQLGRLTGDCAPEEAHRRIDMLWKALAAYVSVVNVTITDEDKAAQVFEVLNDRGVALSVADLLRNHLISTAPSTERVDVTRKLDDVIEQLRGTDLSLLLRSGWLSRFEDVSKKDAYKAIKAGLVQRGISSLTYAKMLGQDAHAYLKLNLTSAPANIPAALSDAIRGFVALRARQPIPLLIAVEEVAPNTSGKSVALERALRDVNALLMQYSIRSRGHNELEAVYSRLARELRALAGDGELGDTQIADFVRSNLARYAIDEATFVSAFRLYETNRGDLQRWMLWELEKVRTKPAGQTLDPSTVHVDHIYPQTPQSGLRWPGHDDIINRVGNLTLLDGPGNQSAGNKPFSEKRSTYQRSPFAFTQDLGMPVKWPDWDEASIDKRQQELATYAWVAWSL